MISIHRVTILETTGSTCRARITLACSSCKPEHRIDFEHTGHDVPPELDKVERAAGVRARWVQVKAMADAGCKDAIAELARR